MGHPIVAFVDPDGTFWPPTLTGALSAQGRLWVPADDHASVLGLLEAALRRERDLMQVVAQVETPEAPEGLWDGWEGLTV